MRLTALVESADHVCARYRLAAFQPALKSQGNPLGYRPWPRCWWSRLLITRELRQTDTLIVQRRLMHPLLLRRIRQAVSHLVFDFDDAIYQRDSFSPKGPFSRRRLLWFAEMCRHADAVVAGNRFLADQAARWTDRGRIHVIPTCVDLTRYPIAGHARSGAGVELVWVGSSSTLQSLEGHRALLEHLGRNHPGLRLKLICDRFLDFENLRTVTCRWSEESEASDIASADIGVSWLPDDDWSRGKCGLKVLQYMAAGLPVVANLVGVHPEMIRHGETGFLADTPGEWCSAISRLAEDPCLRRHMGHAGRELVARRYSVPVGSSRWLHLLGTLSQRGLAA